MTKNVGLHNLTFDELSAEQFAIIDGFVDGDEPVLEVIKKLGCSSATFYKFLKNNGMSRKDKIDWKGISEMLGNGFDLDTVCETLGGNKDTIRRKLSVGRQRFRDGKLVIK